MGLKGMKLHPDYQRVFIDDIRYMRIINRQQSGDSLSLPMQGWTWGFLKWYTVHQNVWNMCFAR